MPIRVSAVLTVFHATRARSTRVLWLCEEMGLPYEVAPVDLKAPKTKAFVAANPAATLPAMVDGDVTMTESVAILQYLCDRYGPTPLAVRADQPEYPAYLQFLFLGEAGLAAPLNAAIGTRLFGKPEDMETFPIKVVIEGFLRRLRLVERRLERSSYLAGEAFTCADISVAYAVGIGHFLGLTERMPTLVRDYHARCVARPAYQKAATI